MASSFDSERCALGLDGLGCAWPGAAGSALVDVSLELAPGECVLLTGPSGSGKSTLLRAAAGLLPRGARLTGTRSGAREGGLGVGLLFQNVETQLLCTTVAEEISFGLANLGVPGSEHGPRVRTALAAVGLRGFEARSVDALSAGQKQRTALAALLALEPRVLALDEPSSQLDAEGRGHLAALLDAEKQRGRAILVADHDPEPYLGVADRTLVLKEGRIQQELRAWAPSPRERSAAPALAPDAPPALDVSGLRALGADGVPVLRDVALRVSHGERVHLFGGNGAGKSTLLRALAARLARAPFHAQAAQQGGRPGSRPPRSEPQASEVPGSAGFLFQDPERNLFERSVRAEIAFSLERRGLSRDAVQARVAELLERCDLVPLADRPPLTLSFGEQHRVALASILAPRPGLLLLDEPFAGLDLPARRRTLEIVAREQARSGAGVLIASHDALPLRGWAHRRLRIEAGRIAHD